MPRLLGALEHALVEPRKRALWVIAGLADQTVHGLAYLGCRIAVLRGVEDALAAHEGAHEHACDERPRLEVLARAFEVVEPVRPRAVIAVCQPVGEHAALRIVGWLSDCFHEVACDGRVCLCVRQRHSQRRRGGAAPSPHCGTSPRSWRAGHRRHPRRAGASRLACR